MPTVKAFDASEGELQEFEKIMKTYLHLNFRAAIGEFSFCFATTRTRKKRVSSVYSYKRNSFLLNANLFISPYTYSFLLYRHLEAYLGYCTVVTVSVFLNRKRSTIQSYIL